jgi:hypothetical protein
VFSELGGERRLDWVWLFGEVERRLYWLFCIAGLSVSKLQVVMALTASRLCVVSRVALL